MRDIPQPQNSLSDREPVAPTATVVPTPTETPVPTEVPTPTPELTDAPTPTPTPTPTPLPGSNIIFENQFAVCTVEYKTRLFLGITLRWPKVKCHMIK
ncbi:hypothetical protein HYW29_02020 [Candidatus Amesbacteria bacterium]|nr:hypothetical protein [Candidatus Amesbacteria bacterium]